jgi:hypothetical protein
MSANTKMTVESTELLPFAHLSDAELLTETRSFVGRSNRLLAELLARLGEVEARGVHRTRSCSSLYTYCIYELRFSEDEAFRRVSAARLVRRFPQLLDAIAAGELHLTGLLMLGPHLTKDNLLDVMARAKHRTKREIARLVRVLDPLPPVPARIEPLGPAPARVVSPVPTWQQFVDSMNPVRELAAGERPCDWGLADEQRESDGQVSTTQIGHRTVVVSGAEPVAVTAPAPARVEAELSGEFVTSAQVDGAACDDLAAPQRYAVQFTATEEYVRLVDEAKALLSHSAPRVTLEEVQLRAMRAFVEALRKRKYAAGGPVIDAANDALSFSAPDDDYAPACAAADAPTTTSASPMRANEFSRTSEPRRRGRHIPAATRRAVAARDDYRCTYADTSGNRCKETRSLEFHHVVPFAVSCCHDVSNLTLRCAAHNALAAEEDFGRDLVQEMRSDTRHERFSQQGP